MKKLDFKYVVRNLEFAIVENTQEKSPEEVAAEIREQIKGWGWDVLDDSFTSEDEIQEWYEEHPDFPEEECEWSAVAEVDFLCDNEAWFIETGHDVDWHTFTITFYGKWGENGIFLVDL